MKNNSAIVAAYVVFMEQDHHICHGIGNHN